MGIHVVKSYLQHGQLNEALEEISKIEETPEVLLSKAEILHFLGSYQISLEIVELLTNRIEAHSSFELIFGTVITKAHILLSMGHLNQVNEIIQNIEKSLKEEFKGHKLNHELWYGKLLVLKAEIHEKNLDHKKAIQILQSSSKIFTSLKDDRELANSFHKLGQVYEANGDLDKALKNYNDSLKIQKILNNSFDQAKSLNRIGVVLGKKSKLIEAQTKLEEAMEHGLKVDFKLELSKIYINLGIITKLQGDLSQADTYHHKALSISKEINDEENLAKSYINIGTMQTDKGELDQANENFSKAIPILEKIGNLQDKSKLLNNLGLNHMKKGQFNQALKNFQESLELKIKLGQKETVASTQQNIGIVYLNKGELNESLTNFEESLKIWENLNNQVAISECLQYIGLIYLQKDHHEISIEYLTKCLVIRKKIKNDLLISETLYYLILSESDRSNINQAMKYFNELTKIEEKTDNKVVKTRKRLSQAILLQNDSRINKKVEAQELFEEVLSEELIDNELTIFAMLKLCEFLLLELKVSGEKEVLVEIKTLLEKLYEMAQEQESHTLLIEILIIQSQLALVEYNIKETKEFLEHANEIAEDKELTQYKLKISYLMDQVEKDVIKFANIASSIPINDRINQLQIESYLKEVADHKDLNSFDPEIFKTGLKKNLQMHLNFANLLLMDKTLPEEMKKYVHFIDLSSKEIQFSISTLLMIEKLEARTYYQNLEDFNCDEIIQFRINHHEEKLNEKSLVVDFQKTNGITTVKSDQYLFSRIIDHLLDNAIKFAEEKSTVKIILETDENSRTITIENECEIIPEHEQSNLFDKYTQYLIHESTRKHGVGLGLAFCDLALKSIKGKVSLVSPRPNKDTGVAVTIIIPKET